MYRVRQEEAVGTAAANARPEPAGAGRLLPVHVCLVLDTQGAFAGARGGVQCAKVGDTL